MPDMKMAAIIPKAMYTGFKMILKVKKFKKKAYKASKIFEKTLRKEGLPPEMAARFAETYRNSVPIPDNLGMDFLS